MSEHSKPAEPITYRDEFIVFPKHSNHLAPIMFGGALMAEMDLCAAHTVRLALRQSPTADYAVTHKVENLTFLKPPYVGDILEFMGEVTELGDKSIVVQVMVSRLKKVVPTSGEKKVVLDMETVAKGTFVFISIQHPVFLEDKPKYLPYVNHNIPRKGHG